MRLTAGDHSFVEYESHGGVAAVLQRCCSGVAAVLQRCCSGVAVMIIYSLNHSSIENESHHGQLFGFTHLFIEDLAT